jgi:hypothetical protein
VNVYDNQTLPDRLYEHMKGMDNTVLVAVAKEMNLDMREHFSSVYEAEDPEDWCDGCKIILQPDSQDDGRCRDCGHMLDLYCKCDECSDVVKKDTAFAFTRANFTRYACEHCHETVEEQLNQHIPK